MDSEGLGASYAVRVVPERHELQVELTLRGIAPGPLSLVVPTWVPGAYGFMKYGRDLFDLRATDLESGVDLPMTREGWSGFTVAAISSGIKVAYTAHAYDPAWGELAGIVDSHQAVLLGTRYLFAPAHRGPCRVEYRLPVDWRLHHPAGAREVRPGVYDYPSYAALLDTPVVAGAFEVRSRVSHGVAIHVVFLDRTLGFEREADRFVDSLLALAEACHEVFGSYPFERYTFVLTFSPNARWGLEHANGTMIALDAATLIDDKAWFDGIRVCAHELFHAWNVCRLKPTALMKLDHVEGAFTDALWVSEGVTRYYEFLLSTRMGALSPERFISNLVGYYRQHQALPASARVSAVDSSRATFLNHNRYPGSVNNSIDYYDVGMLLAFGMDATFRLASPADTLDAAFGDFYAAFRDQGFTTADLRRFMASRSEAVGRLVEREAEAPGRLSTVALLRALGFEVRLATRRLLGVVLAENSGPVIANVLDTSPAGQCGLAAGDEIVRLNSFQYSLKALRWLIDHESEIEIEVKRGARRLTFSVPTGEREELAELRWRGNESQLAVWRRWLGAPALAFEQGQRIDLDHYSNFHGVQTVF